MTTAQIEPGRAVGKIPAPPSKSYTHRALVLGYLAGHRVVIRNPLLADDTRATLHGLEALGGRVRRRATSWTIEGAPLRPSPRRRVRIRCGSSGTTLRFLAAVAAAGSTPVELVGSPELGRRPIEPLARVLRRAGAEVYAPTRESIPLRVAGPIRPGPYIVDGSTSSQFVSALLLVLPSLAAPSTLRVTGRRVSAPYIDATVATLRAFGVRVAGTPGRWKIEAPQRFRAAEFAVPGDASSAAYLWAAGAITGGRVEVDNLPARWPQSDLAVLKVLRRAGAQVRATSEGAVVEGPVRHGFDVDLTSSPDLYPLAGAVASVIPHVSRLRGAAHARFKESDRRSETVRLARALGAEVRWKGSVLEIHGRPHPARIRFSGSSDHRVVMSAAVAALASDRNSRVAGAESVQKSFPGFWSSMRTLGMGVSIHR